MIRIYSIIAFFAELCVVFMALLVAHRKLKTSGSNPIHVSRRNNSPKGFLPDALWRILPYLIITVGIVLRFYKLGQIPYGLNNDEASIGYDAWALATYGIDRNGYPWPIYPITWGSGGGGPMVVYLAVLTEKLLGHSILALRLPSAILGAMTLPVFYALLRRVFDSKTATAGLILLTFNPWHLLMSRFTLDCNTLAFWLVIALFLFLVGTETQKTGYLFLSAVFFALCLYVYGSATIVIPVFLLLFAFCAYMRKNLSIKQLICSAVVFILVLLPLIIFYAVNFLDLPAVMTPYFSIPRFVTSRSVFYTPDRTLPANMLKSFVYVIRFLTTGPLDTEVVCNQLPGYGVFYRFTFLLTLTGLGVSVYRFIRNRNNASEEPAGTTDLLITGNLILFALTFLFSIFLRLEISRMTLFLVPVLILQTIGLSFLLRHTGERGLMIATATVCLGAVLFTRNYFGRHYREISAQNFMPGYGDAVRYADTVRTAEQTVYSTYQFLTAPFSVALYYTQTPVQDFIDTVVYRDEISDARIATAFTHFVFGLPEDIHENTYRDDILILHESELQDYPEADYEITTFDGYAVLQPVHADRTHP